MSYLPVWYTHTAAGASLAAVVTEPGTGKVYSPSARAFVAASGANDALIPLANVGGPLLPLSYTAAVPVAVPAPAGCWVTVHPAAGGAALSDPIYAPPGAADAPPPLKVAVLVG